MACVCLGLNVQWGQTGLFNVGVAGFVAIGAYASAILTTPPSDGPSRRLRAADRSRLAGAAIAAGGASAFVGAADAAAARRLSRHHDVRRRRRGAARRAQRAMADRRRIRHRLHPPAVRKPGLDAGRSTMSPISRWSPPSSWRSMSALERLARSPWGRVLRAIREDERRRYGARQVAGPLSAAGVRARRRR